jgi:N-acetylneuraminate synthase
MYGSDAANSMEPKEFRQLSQGLRDIWLMLEKPVDKDDIAVFGEMKRIFEKSIVASHSIPEGQVLTADDLAFKKPGDGIPAARYRELVGRIASRPMAADHKIGWNDLRDR